MGMALDPMTFVNKALSVNERLSLADSIGDYNANTVYFHSWFFRGASTAFSGDDENPLVIFYNPLVDAAIVSAWSRADGPWRLISSYLMDGQAIRIGAGRSDMRRSMNWLNPGGPYLDALMHSYALRNVGGAADAGVEVAS